ncbi:GGDEF and EAL domain-containing protein [Hoeflea sp. BAL378]|uniref:putative bifunctional diguanylate cyclase/phosphodiesterase n=1 Tax=Hoeflea sp. BAL378 TaxID=1547437 RepID=UPI0009DEE113|nr:GGDEF and EAL domain-containing protein [Hoeflea sp. BAL378]
MKKAIDPPVEGPARKSSPATRMSRQTPMDRLLEANARVQMDAAGAAVPEQPPDVPFRGLQQSPDEERLLFRAMIDQVPDYLFVKDPESRFVIANRAVAADLGREPDDLIGLTDFDLHQHALAGKFFADEQAVIRSGKPLIDIEEMVVDFEGKEKWFATSKVPLRDGHGRVIGLVGVCRDITDRKQAEAQMQFMALHDALTGLPNRTLFMDRLAQGILQAGRTGQRLTAIFIDLDNFKTVNDSLGHTAGDTLLKVLAERMVAAVRACDTVARLGGDEFVILLADQDRPATASTRVLEKIRMAIAEPVMIKGQSFRVTGSIGVAGYPEDGADADALLLNADIAMYEAKASGRDNFRFYSKGIDEAARERRLLQDHLLGAISSNEFALLYQPQVDLETGRIFAVEALVRWNHPTLGQISPARFIPLAEENGVIVALGEWVLREACRQNRAWQDAGLPPITVCVNVSARQMSEGDWVGQVTEILRETGLAARHLELELTETMLMHDVNQAIAVMKELQALGVNFSIDDFGTGYSSLSALKSLPVVRIKIDRSFISNLTTDTDDQNIARAVILLGQKLNIRVIAEGVETEEQLAFLRDNNCHEVQGYYFSKPVAPEGIAALLGRDTAFL